MDIIDKIFCDLPNVHSGETETNCRVTVGESSLDPDQVRKLADGAPACYGISMDVARFIHGNVDDHSRTIETGCGVSTLIFALRRAEHTAVTPNGQEVGKIRDYAAGKGIDLSTIKFVIDKSEAALPKIGGEPLDMALIDGKHAFPWPILDWFYTADRLKKNGFMIVDDAQIPAVRILIDFLLNDCRWDHSNTYGGKTFVFRKLTDSVHDVAWHMQHFSSERKNDLSKAGLLARISRWRRSRNA